MPKKRVTRQLQKGMVFRTRPTAGHARYVRIVGIRGRRSHQPVASYREVSRNCTSKQAPSGWQRTLRHEKGYDARVWLQWDEEEQRWWMPSTFEWIEEE